MAALEVADGAVAVPAFVGVFGPVHPGGVVGEVGAEMEGVQGRKIAATRRRTASMALRMRDEMECDWSMDSKD